ncbi:Single-stranded DNA-binding protein [Zancudomyces culisetae]|uniref:Single-stranded DNA-binding protein n=1 Tax=Zancudomyces culisetae TaxID=1213189 RepID=A0A1R1PZ69_ZANCU|nr:Single-stranded DNA-binding protein [Zancudomyces culisetae]|eukprot:OMH86239.1 Single-stranded DNA-binding protein [Zancudomyces culisetae]
MASRRSYSINKVILVGRVGNEPEVKEIGEGKKAVNLSLATGYKYKNASGDLLEKTNWHRVNAYNMLAERIEKSVSKGALLYVEGRIDYQTYEKEGVEHNSTVIYADKMTVLQNPKKPEDGTQEHE